MPALAQTNMPVLNCTVSFDGVNFMADAPHSGSWIAIRLSSPGSASGGWVAPIADAVVVNTAYFDHQLGLDEMRKTDVTLEAMEAQRGWNLVDYSSYPLMHARAVDAHAFLARAVPGSSSSEIVNTADPIYLSESGNPADPIVQPWGITHGSHWHAEMLDEWQAVKNDSGDWGFNLDNLLQRAVWRRVGDAMTQSNIDRELFFNGSDHWSMILASGYVQSITFLGIRGNGINPADGVTQSSGDTPPDLRGYPTRPPRMTTSNRATITFVGTIDPPVGGLRFTPPWILLTQPIPPQPIGGYVTFAASGFLPHMQVALVKVNNQQPRYEVTPLWADFGRIKIPVPANAASGTLEVRQCRYRIPSGGGFTFSPWQTIPVGHRPRITVP